ncbi:MAG: hypothetical protein KME22_11025 [Hassallia sp. WJT32-NPBG1]|jgi:hypothetical protein|nr:hypothetical protein [Hassallia sp. WJT32-NPBG1]
MTQQARSPRNKRQPKPLPDEDSSISKINKTYLDFLDSLSEEQREDFLNFGNKKASELPKPPILPSKWIETHFEELRCLWRAKPSQWEKENSTNALTPSGAANSTKVHDFESWEGSTHEGQYHTLMNLGLVKFCENTTSSAWYEWARAKHPERFIKIPD